MVALSPALNVTAKTFARLCQENPELRLELTAQGELIIMSPSGSDSSRQNLNLSAQLWYWNQKRYWNQKQQLGVAFDSSAGFTLPNGAIRSPDAAWIAKERWEKLTPSQQRKFAPLCPDLVLELKSPSDNLSDLQDKLAEYIKNGAQLGWLIDPDPKQVYIYRPGQLVEQQNRPDFIAGAPLYPDLIIDLTALWD